MPCITFPNLPLFQYYVCTAFSSNLITSLVSVGSVPSDKRSALASYTSTASALLTVGYYSGLISAVKSCFEIEGTFLILDCPSGSGKTQAGVALRQLDHSNSPQVKYPQLCPILNKMQVA